MPKPKKKRVREKAWKDYWEQRRAAQEAKLYPTCMIPDCGCSGKAHA